MLQRVAAGAYRHGCTGFYRTRQRSRGYLEPTQRTDCGPEFLGDLVPTMHRRNAIAGADAAADEGQGNHCAGGECGRE